MRSRTRLIAIVASLLVCIAMVGTGFATWVILDNKEQTTTGNVTAEAISDESITFTAQPSKDANVYYGAPADATGQAGYWLVATDESVSNTDETLTFTITLTFGGNIGSISYTFAGGSAFEDCKTKNLVADPTVEVKADGTSVTKSGEGGTVTSVTFDTDGKTLMFDGSKAVNAQADSTVVLTVTFKWGTAFNNTNPYTYFNTGDGRERNGKVTSTLLSAIGQKESGEVDFGSSGKIGTDTTNAQAAKVLLDYMNNTLLPGSSSANQYTFTFTALSASSAKT